MKEFPQFSSSEDLRLFALNNHFTPENVEIFLQSQKSRTPYTYKELLTFYNSQLVTEQLSKIHKEMSDTKVWGTSMNQEEVFIETIKATFNTICQRAETALFRNKINEYFQGKSKEEVEQIKEISKVIFNFLHDRLPKIY